MSTEISTTGVHHIRLIVTDPIRARDFYTRFLNFTVAAELLGRKPGAPQRSF